VFCVTTAITFVLPIPGFECCMMFGFAFGFPGVLFIMLICFVFDLC